MTRTGLRTSVSGPAGREKSVELPQGVLARCLNLEEVVEVRKATGAANVAGKLRKADENGDRERERLERQVAKKAAGF